MDWATLETLAILAFAIGLGWIYCHTPRSRP